MKQMYKVFINDQVICFTTPGILSKKQALPIDSTIGLAHLPDFLTSSENLHIPAFQVISDNPKKSFNTFLKKFRLIRAAGGIVLHTKEANKVLMIFRLGKWDLPKGKIEKGENRRNAAKREVEEECGVLEIKILQPCNDTFHLYQLKGKWVIKQTHWYLMNGITNGEPVPQTEEGITEAKWLKKSQIRALLPLSYSAIASLLKETILSRN
ncbi:MAG: Diadenosine hexaphosphate hydrolase [Bacteroidetes bacterium ADurb.Bin397]|nr:MAG: Diadenosine hexaphosphate hydrolase [Bacteroidetes bacterium ADurb.Bin397]